MMSKINHAMVRGKFAKPFEFDHSGKSEDFYRTEITTERLSGIEDRIPVVVSEHLIDTKEDFTGEPVEIFGQFRSYNRHEDGKSKLILFLFALNVSFAERALVPANEVYLDGFICKPPVYRKTPLGRDIADILIAVNRPGKKSDYIPCICWSRDAARITEFKVGDHVIVQGRIQSREYTKHIENRYERRIAYEVSVGRIDKGE